MHPLYQCFTYTVFVIGESGLHAVLNASTLQYKVVPQDFYSLLSVSAERSCPPCIRCCGTDGFQGQSQCFCFVLSCSLIFCLLLFSISLLLSIGWYCGAWVFGLTGCKSLSPSLAMHNNNNNNNNTQTKTYGCFRIYMSDTVRFTCIKPNSVTHLPPNLYLVANLVGTKCPPRIVMFYNILTIQIIAVR